MANYHPGDVVPAEVVREIGAEHFFRVVEIPDSVFEMMKGKSYKSDCTVPREKLRYLLCLHKDIEGVTRVGEMVLNRSIAYDVLDIFRELYRHGYPIERMRLVDLWDADDEKSMRENNSSSFNFRFISHSKTVSKHGLGMAVDINPLYNPYHKVRKDGAEIIEPATGAPYLDRNADFDYKIVEGDLCWTLFTRYGFEWGGAWTSCKDYQHFEMPSNPVKPPLIGISPCGNEKNYNVNSPTFISVFRAGGVPMMLSMVRSEREARMLMDKIDGLVMVGGEDIHPAYYGEEILNETVDINGFRDTSDFYLANAALERGLPVLGICRGEQILNVVCGGSLYQDIPSQIGIHVTDSAKRHWIFIDRSSRLHNLLGVDSVTVNSFHHQSVKVPGRGLTVTARAGDGVIEAYEGGSIFAVQFHPEHFIAAGDTVFLPIFKDLIERARK